ncbi:MAG: ABC transporter ATP-binding protein [Planctomycetia bacterium]|nr:ABC transporter ATP-binding protein [Planctomycetia bacterium]
MQKIIEVSQLTFGYSGTPVLENLNFTIFSGDCVGLIGANGAGKSTLLKLLLGEVPFSYGKIEIFGEHVKSFRQWWKVGYVPQNSITLGGNFPATAEEVVMGSLSRQIRRWCFFQKEHKERVREALEMVGMQECAQQLIGTLSGGQRQRVMLARVLVNRPEILLLDEPASGIDDRSTHSFYRLLEKLNREEGITILMITHDLREAAEHFSRVLCLEEGSVMELDPSQLADELRHRHKHPCRHCHLIEHAPDCDLLTEDGVME